MTCMHGQGTYYPRRIYKVTVLKAMREMSVGLAHNLPYPMIGRDCKEIYEVLNTMKDREGCQKSI